MMSRSKKRWLAGTTILLLLVGAAVYWFEWNMLRGPIANRIEKATGRSFAINGDLDVRLSMTPRITAEKLVLGNAPWASEPSMAEIGRADFTIDLLALLRGRTVLPEIRLSEARVVLEKNAGGEANWDFGKEKGEPPAIGTLTLDRTNITYRDPAIKTDFATEASTVPAGEKDGGMLQVTGRGQVNGLKGSIDGVIGGVLALTSADKPYPVRLRAVVGSTRCTSGART